MVHPTSKFVEVEVDLHVADYRTSPCPLTISEIKGKWKKACYMVSSKLLLFILFIFLIERTFSIQINFFIQQVFVSTKSYTLFLIRITFIRI